jgi:hypothetical protein
MSRLSLERRERRYTISKPREPLRLIRIVICSFGRLWLPWFSAENRSLTESFRHEQI